MERQTGESGLRSHEWDLFISYASEDRSVLVATLVDILTQFGLRVWWDRFELKTGDSLSRTIDQGLAKSRFGVVVISRAFLEKRWTEYELRGLTAREMSGTKVILPIWFGVTTEDIVQYSPPLADKVAISVAASPTHDEVLKACIAILSVVDEQLLTRLHRRAAYDLHLRKTPVTEIPFESLKEMAASVYRHDSLPDALVGRIRLIRAALLLVHPRTMEFWVDGFRRDAHPTREVEMWEHVAAVFLELVQFIKLDSDDMQALFRFFTLQMIGASEDESFPERLEEHRDLILASFQSMHPVLELASTDDEDIFLKKTQESPARHHMEEFDEAVSPELAKRVADLLAAGETEK